MPRSSTPIITNTVYLLVTDVHLYQMTSSEIHRSSILFTNNVFLLVTDVSLCQMNSSLIPTVKFLVYQCSSYLGPRFMLVSNDLLFKTSSTLLTNTENTLVPNLSSCQMTSSSIPMVKHSIYQYYLYLTP